MLYLSVFGLNLSLINELKQTISQLLDTKYQLTWTNIADPNLNFLFIHEDFIDLPNIQAIIAKKIHYLTLSRHTHSDAQLVNNCLYLPLTQPLELQHWLNRHLTANSIEAFVQTKKTNKKANYAELKDFIDEINANSSQGKYIIEYKQQMVALLDFDSHRFYGQSQLNIQHPQLLQLSRATINNIMSVKQMPCQDLKQGLWQFYWHNLNPVQQLYAQYYQITFWPQLPNYPEQQKLFKLAAMFQHGADVASAQSHSQLNLEEIQHFLFCAELCNACREMSAKEAKFKSSNTVQSAKPMQSFFQKLRAKLGL